MKQIAFMFALAVATLANPADAATMLINNGNPYTYVVHANSAGSGTSLDLATQPGSYIVNVFSPNTLSVGNGNGVASITGDFSSLTIDPAPPILGFSVIQFKLDGPNGAPAGRGRDFDILVNFLGGGSQTFSNIAFPANDKFDILAGSNEVITNVHFSDLINNDGNPTNFVALKQVSFNAVFAPIPGAVPEPASWALMLAGFGIAGAAMRRRRSMRVADA